MKRGEGKTQASKAQAIFIKQLEKMTTFSRVKQIVVKKETHQQTMVFIVMRC